jgi:transcriptional regulator with XRE-family HTH domain
MNELGILLRELRGKKSLRAVADETGLSHSYISDIEKGFRRGTKTPINPSADTLKRLANAYEYPYEKLLKAAGYLSDDVDAYFEDGEGNIIVVEVKNHDEIFDSIAEINKLVKKYGIEQMGFFDIEEWNNLGPEDIRLLEEQFKLIVKLAKERKDKD